MAWIFVDKESEGGSNMRSQMRRNMRSGGGYRRTGGVSYRDGYEHGYRHGWEDHEDEEFDGEMRRARDSRGRYV